MSTADIVLIILLAIGAIRGFGKGLIMEIAGLLALVIGLFGAFQLVDWGASLLRHFQIDIGESWAPIIAFIILFILILVSVYLLGRFVKAVLHITPLGIMDSFLGSVVGLIKWAFGISLVLWIIEVLEVGFVARTFNDSLVLPYISQLAPLFVDFIAMAIPYFQELLSSIEALFKQSQP